LAEQEKIVEILEEQLSRLDAALASVRTVREKAAKFRRSLLHAAFTGALTGHDTSTSDVSKCWSKCALNELVEFSPKIPADVLRANVEFSFVPMPSVAEVSGHVDTSQVITASEGKRRNLTYFADGDIIFAKITPCMENGKIARPSGLTGGAAFGSTEFHVMRPSSRINGEFLRLYLVHDDFRYDAERAMTGAVGQRRVPRKYLESYEFPLPPLADQEKIVEILEEQLSRLDASLAVAKAVEKRAAALRRSLLHSAFTGQITKHWRESKS
jgi:type I restriction enzyme S subunit